jgi:hypothetical protein
MAAPIGNQFWKLAPRVGRKLIYQTPVELEADCMEYLEVTSERAITVKDWVGKDATAVDREMRPPFTIWGLCTFLGMDERSWVNYRNREEFFPICTRVEQIIKTQKFEGASVGIYNANIIARDLGLRDVSDVNVNDARKDVAGLFPEDLEEKK